MKTYWTENGSGAVADSQWDMVGGNVVVEMSSNSDRFTVAYNNRSKTDSYLTWDADANFDTVQKIFIGYYQRPADPGGLTYWAGRLGQSGGGLSAIIEAFANSAESRTLYGTIDSGNIATVVENIYLALFNREADAGGRDYYVNGFNAGQFTAATIMLNVLYGAQNDDLVTLNNKLSAANLFTRTIDPDLDGSSFQATYAGDVDVIASRNFLNLYATSVKIATQAETTAYIRANIADPGDGILSQ